MEEKNKTPEEMAPVEDNKNENAQQSPEDKNGNYAAQGLVVGMAIGAVFGILFDSMAIGMGVGMCLGLAVGASIKKKKTK